MSQTSGKLGDNKPMVHVGDALEWLKTWNDQSVDAVITDPPYSALEAHRAVGTTTRLKVSKGSSNEWFPTVSDEYLGLCFQEFARIVKPRGHVYVMASHDQIWPMRKVAKYTGCFFQHLIVWDKQAVGMGYHYRNSWEGILFFSAGKKSKKLQDLGQGDVLRFKRLKGKPPKVWPAQKPVGLMRVLVANSTQPGDLVIDPFLGAGASTGVATVLAGRRFRGCEIKPDYAKEAQRRIKEIFV